MNLSDLLKKDIFEDRKNEWKQRLNEEDPLSWLKSVAGFANGNGGTLYIGVKDDGTLCGFTQDEIDHEMRLFLQNIRLYLSPRPYFTTQYPRYAEGTHSLYIIAINIPSSEIKPIYTTYKGAQNVYLRDEGYVRLASRDEIGTMYLRSENVPFDMQKTDIRFSPKNFKKLYARYEEATGKKLTEKVLDAISFFDESGFLRQGSLFFQDDYSGEDTLIKAVQWPSLNRATDTYLHPASFQGNLLDAVEFALSFVRGHSSSGFQKTPHGRVEYNAYPKRSVYAAVVNAFVHRNYYLQGSFITLDLFRDRLEICSPGSLVSGYGQKETIYDIASIRPQNRNPLISRVFQLLQMMESLGTGFDKITQEYASYGENKKPFVTIDHESFLITLPDTQYGPGIVNASIAPEIRHGYIDSPTEYDDKILSYCYAAPRSVKEIATYLGISVSTHLRKGILGNLESQGFLTPNLKGKTTYYQSNPDSVYLL